MRINDIKPQFVLVMGGAGSGKNYFIAHSAFSSFKLIDVDAIKGGMELKAAIGQIKPMLISAFENKENVAHPTTGANLLGQQNKIKLARQYGYSVTLVLIDTDPAAAIGNVRNRVRDGGHDVEIEDIVSSNNKARANYEQLAPLVDTAKII